MGKDSALKELRSNERVKEERKRGERAEEFGGEVKM